MKRFALFFGLLMLVLAVASVAFADPALAEPISWKMLLGSGAAMPALLINASTLSNIFINLKTTFNKAFDAAPSVWSKIAMLVPSNGSQNDYAWLENFPKMRQWVGDKVLKALKAGKYVLVNQEFEATVSVARRDIETDQLGVYAPQAQNAGFSARQWPDELVMDMLTNGFTNLCFDGKPFYSTTHQVVNPVTGKPANVSNKLTVPLSAATQAAAIASLGAARTAMKKFKDDEGRPLNITPNLLVVGPALEDVANVLAMNDRLEDGKPNPFKGTVEVLVDARIATDTEFHLLDTTKPVKPIVFQQRKAPVFVSQTDLSSDSVFMRGEYNFGAEASGAAGYGFWQLAVGSTGAG